ncbi:MAG: alpha/beta hydrolase family protein [Anaerolineae bacterium]
MSYDPISQDPPHDPDFPAEMAGFSMNHAGALLNGVIYVPVGEGLHPLALLLHGLPGHERNFDLAHILRRAGWAVCVFHYRGAWGSEGAYRFAHVLEDVQAVVAYFRQRKQATPHRIDPERVILIGHSLGGWAGLQVATTGAVDAVASLSGVNIGIWAQQLADDPELARAMLQSLIADSLGPLQAVTPDDIIAEVQTHGETWNLVQHAPALSQQRVLLVGAKRDTIVPVFDHHVPLVNALIAHDADALTTHMLATDHGYSDSRIALARVVLDWLASI